MSPTHRVGPDTPVFGFILMGGSLGGALVSDVRLANELSRRGFRVHVWWVMDHFRQSIGLRQEIKQHWLFNGLRYAHVGPFERPRGLKDHLGRLATALAPEGFWSRQAQCRNWAVYSVHSFMRGVVERVVLGVGADRRLARRFARDLDKAGVTHVCPMLEMFGAWPLAARRYCRKPPGVLVTFQGYEICLNYVRTYGREAQFIERLREIVRESDWPAISVSQCYSERIVKDLGIAESSLTVVPPGVPTAAPMGREEATKTVSGMLKGFRPGVKLVTFIGRRDAEKGLDLLLYAANLLRARGVEMQLAIAGPTLNGTQYVEACQLIAENLRLPVLWHGEMSERERDALFEASDVVVYPSIGGEPFGMVPVEAMALGTPVVVPDDGGVSEVIGEEECAGGIRFKAWDSADLAERIGRLLSDGILWKRCSEAGPKVSSRYTVEKMTDRILTHLGIPVQPGAG